MFRHPLIAGLLGGLGHPAHTRPCSPALSGGHGGRVFFLFSNRLGCLGSLAVSAVLTLVLLLVLDVL